MPDPANPQSLNRYAYVLNNPLRYTDPTGHRVCEADPQSCQPQSASQPSPIVINAYALIFTPNWEEADIEVVLQAALITENALRRADFATAQRYAKYLFDYDVYIRFDARNGVVRSIGVDSDTFNLQRSERFTRDWKRYAWDQILTRYGPPSWVGIALQPPMEPNAPTIYGLSLIYEQLGFEIGYQGPAQYDPKASLMRACPDFNAVTAISLRLVSPEDSVVELLLSESHAPSLGPSLEETTGMSVQTFYETFRNANSGACLEELPHLNNP